MKIHFSKQFSAKTANCSKMADIWKLCSILMVECKLMEKGFINVENSTNFYCFIKTLPCLFVQV